MTYRSLRECVEDLEANGDLRRVAAEIDPDLEIAAVQRRLFAAGGPAVLFENVRGCAFPAVANLFGTLDRCRFLFRHTLERLRHVISLRADPGSWRASPLRSAGASWTALTGLPRRVRSGPVLESTCNVSELPQIRSWPLDGGPFITLPQVFTEDPSQPSVIRSNLGMYRIQLSGNDYEPEREIGLHYQIHRGIGVHHTRAVEAGTPLRVSVFVGGPPAHTFAAVMPLPEGLSELLFAGMLGGRRFRYVRRDGWVISADADFCLTGTVDPERTLPEGPFGDHLGYYSLQHEFPVLRVESIDHRRDAIWPFTVVGRPPQEDTCFGELIHEITGPMVPRSIPGVRALHAVDAAGVHPLLLAIGSERYVPYGERVPQELLTIANAILGFGQCSLAKYLWIAAGEDDTALDANDIPAFFRHVLERVDWARDLHFQTRTTIDTLDYSGTGLNSGSKLVVAAAGPARRTLGTRVPPTLQLPDGFRDAAIALPGVLVVGAPAYADRQSALAAIERLTAPWSEVELLTDFPLVVLVDDSVFTARDLRNFLWVTFTRSNPSHDVHGIRAFSEDKHWGCHGSLVIDARSKPHHAPPLEEDPEVTTRVEALAAAGGPLHGLY